FVTPPVTTDNLRFFMSMTTVCRSRSSSRSVTYCGSAEFLPWKMNDHLPSVPETFEFQKV
ncbi:MAG: hypothetical protein II037_00420, partial [Bacteroidales bacterium]|nr:hypothetical protein [Bacteroidales bacterium]